MAYKDIKDKGFDKRTTEELLEITRKGGQASGKARRRKADFRKTLNMLLTAKIDSPEWEPILQSLGVDTTLETAMLMSMIKAALDGNVKAAYFVAQYAGQSDKTAEDIKNKEADTELKEARKKDISGENETDEALARLDEILEGLKNNATDQQTK